MNNATAAAGQKSFSGIAAVVLAGGGSVRMGTDKSQLVRPDGRTQLNYLIDCLKDTGITDIIISGRQPEDRRTDEEHFVDEIRPAPPWVTDIFTDKGPLGGIHAAIDHYLRRSRNSDRNYADHSMPITHLLVVPCDMPCLRPEPLRLLCHQTNTTAFSGSLFPLIISNPEENIKLLEEILNDNKIPSVKYFLNYTNADFIETDEEKFIQNYLINTNTPEDWNRFFENEKNEKF